MTIRRTIAVLATTLLLVPGLSAQQHTRPPQVPPYIVFAGDTVRFDRDDLYERMDRELITFTYMQTGSTLMLKRANRYFTQIVPILRKNGIPEDLKYLMAIESNLDPKSVSVTGAAGLWQFMKASAVQYGLTVNTEVDERYHTAKATAAACRYLREAYAKYGDWMTVAASYNAGQAGISRRLEGQHQDSAMDLYLNEETSRYMFRILAAKMFFENPSAFGYNIPRSASYPLLTPSAKVTVTATIPSLVEFAASHGTTLLALKLLNPWLRSDHLTIAPGKSYEIDIP